MILNDHNQIESVSLDLVYHSKISFFKEIIKKKSIYTLVTNI